jgi:sugar/nucleoside kinase (ribokinase family)
MKSYDIFIFGHTSVDLIKTPAEAYEMTSGPILYSVWTGHQLGYSVGVLTKTAPEDRHRLDAFPVPREDLFWRESSETVRSTLEYRTDTMEKRVITNQRQADPYLIGDFPEFSARLVHFCSLFTGEADLEVIRFVGGKAPLAVDVQGLLRKIFEDGSVRYVPWEEKARVLPLCRFFKADAAEAAFITGIDTETHEGRITAARQFVDWGAEEVILSHNEELIAAHDSRVVSAPLKNRTSSGRTGRGDTCFTSYMTERFKNPPEQAIKFAAALTSLKLQVPGPFKKTRKEVAQFMETFYGS